MISRKVKYTIVADLIERLITSTPFLDGGEAPPRVINYAGSGDFAKIGDNTVQLLVKYSALSSNQKVLEIGCGIARNALALRRKFHDGIHYTGFDVVRYGIAWSKKHFGNDNLNYKFKHADVFNSFYNPRGKLKPTEYFFDYHDSSFDLVFATSVFTHMQEREFYHFIDESMRVLRPGGNLYFTAFIWNGDSIKTCESGVASFSFKFTSGFSRLEKKEEPDVAVAHNEERLFEFLERFPISNVSYHAGTWRGGDGIDFQDIVVVKKSSQ